ncbi:fructosamine kinase family protein [Rathayibacter tritici]|uniref:Fructosamine kinase n=1 Tax=Rathayibacter tritici TaxID=33888 RepID=A0A160KR60_9MICO|nr:fructosamine kinase family protein [Rathayibacter tritici]AND15729.1 fructosamine kinase [Rathayibacter tritici]PPI45473.1 fructosamine kinase [Rathayibacter tritici]
MPFVKSDPRARPQFFEWEAAGLDWLRAAAGGVACVPVLTVSPGRIELEQIRSVRPTRSAAREFGAALARTHEAGAPAFGAPPTGWSGPAYIGRRAMTCRPDSSWGRFWAEQRVRPFLGPAVDAGNLSATDASTVERALEFVTSGVFDDGSAPARIHGDLWTGNVLWSGEGAVIGAVLIDPAAHGGHRETDLAMLALFGTAHLDAVLEGYHEQHPLAAGVEERIPLHQLHPLAVHAAGHGPSYGRALADAAARVIALAR